MGRASVEGSALKNNVPPAVVDRGVARPGLTDWFLPNQSAGYPIFLELVGHDGTARLCQIFVRLGFTGGTGARLDDDPLGTGVLGTLGGIRDYAFGLIG